MRTGLQAPVRRGAKFRKTMADDMQDKRENDCASKKRAWKKHSLLYRTMFVLTMLAMFVVFTHTWFIGGSGLGHKGCDGNVCIICNHGDCHPVPKFKLEFNRKITLLSFLIFAVSILVAIVEEMICLYREQGATVPEALILPLVRLFFLPAAFIMVIIAINSVYFYLFLTLLPIVLTIIGALLLLFKR
jgi:hypothetical protein